MKLKDKIAKLTIPEMVEITEEMKQTTVPAEAKIRELIKDTEFDTSAVVISFIAVSQLLCFEFAERLKTMLNI